MMIDCTGYKYLLSIYSHINVGAYCTIFKVQNSFTELSSNVKSIIGESTTFNVANQSVAGAGGTGIKRTTNEDGSINIKLEEGTGQSGYYWVGFKLNEGCVWDINHQYAIAVDVKFNQNSKSDSNLNSFGIYGKKNWNTNVIQFAAVNKLPTGERGTILYEVYKTFSGVQDGSNIFLQVGKFDNTGFFDIDIYRVCVVDLTASNLSYNEFANYISRNVFDEKLNFVKNSQYATFAAQSTVAEFAEAMKQKDIDIWGDSLTAQAHKWGDYLSTLTGRNVYSHGFGGRTSTYIRDQFLSGYNRDRACILWVGRNNNTRVESILDDIRIMVDTLGHNDFLIMPVINGAYSGEYRGGKYYENFIEIADRLSKEYPDNFLDIRSAIINGWRGANVQLVSAFTQPEIGGEINIEVSDAQSLTTLNEYDTNSVNKFVIGLNHQYDIYSVISTDGNVIRAKLESANRIKPGGLVNNLVDPSNDISVGTSSAIEYLRVMQYGDYYCINELDTIPSSARTDLVHLTDACKEFVAKIVARTLRSKGI